MMESEIAEEKDKESLFFINQEAEKEKIRQIIEHQKTLYWSSSSSSSLSSSAASCSSFSSSHKRSSLLELMKVGSTSLRRLFDMEHTTLAAHFQEYSGSPIVKTIPLWGSETDDEIHDYWAHIKGHFGSSNDVGSEELSKFASDGSFQDRQFGFRDTKVRRKLSRKKSFRRLPGFRLWRLRGFKFGFRFMRRIRILICGKIL